MTTSNETTWRNMRSKLKAMGKLTEVYIGEPKSPPEFMSAAIIPTAFSTPETTLSNPREDHELTIRFYADAMAEPVERTELALDQLRADVQADFYGDFDLGGSMAYALPTTFAGRYGYQEIGGRIFRLLDITFGYRVDDRAPFTQ